MLLAWQWRHHELAVAPSGIGSGIIRNWQWHHRELVLAPSGIESLPESSVVQIGMPVCYSQSHGGII